MITLAHTCNDGTQRQKSIFYCWHKLHASVVRAPAQGAMDETLVPAAMHKIMPLTGLRHKAAAKAVVRVKPLEWEAVSSERTMGSWKGTISLDMECTAKW